MSDFLTISLSENEPSYSWLTKVAEPEGNTPIKPLYVTWLWQCKYKELWVEREDGRWQSSSVQSNMHRVEGYVLLNISGISSLICSGVGKIGIEPRQKNKKIVQVII